jgi:signal transduction histidine kinase
MWFVQPQGLARFREGRFTSFTKADGLPDTHIRSVMRDREGTLWVSTQGGLARFTEPPIVTYTTRNGLAADNTYPIIEDRRGDIWIGGWPGLTRYRQGAFTDITATLGLAPNLRPNITALMEDREGAVWIATLGQGITRLNEGGATTIIAATVDWNYYAMFQSRSGDVWIAGDRGAHRYHDGVIDPALALGGAASVFHEDARGVLWIGGVHGLFRYEGGVVTQLGDRDGFSGTRVRAIRSDSDGTMWIGTYDTGLFRYRDGRFTRYTTAEGLPANGAFQILEDAQQRFWICSNSGIYRVTRSELDAVAAGGRRTVTAVRYGRDDGMANQECNGLSRPAGIRAADGRFWFPTQGGVAVVNPATLANTLPPPVALLDLKVGGVSSSSLDRIEIRSGSTSIEVQYTALTFVRPELAQFKFMMEGLETDWNDAGTDRTARYARLPYGDFRFRVIAANREGVWNETGAGIDIVVIPPFWRTTWFMWLMIAAVGVAAYGGHRWRLAGIERKQAVQQAFARQLIDSQETDRKRIASELHDGVSQTLVVIRNWAAGRRIGDIAEAASQALGEVRNVVHDLLPLHLERMGLVEAMRDAATRVGDASGIAITCRFDKVDNQLSTETALRLFRVAQEGLNNVVKHSGATTASLDVTLEPAHVRLTIQDNGKGFEPRDISPTSAGDGFGLVGMAERARMMGGDLTITSAPGRGTTIIIIVPRVAPRRG